MAENDDPVTFRRELEAHLLASSTKRRISKLNSTRDQIENQKLSDFQIRIVSGLLFQTYALYIDRSSRAAVHDCLNTIVSKITKPETLEPFILAVKNEASKESLAPANYFVLTEWCDVLLIALTQHLDLWSKFSLPILEALAAALEKTYSESKHGTQQSAIISTRRALRTIFRTDKLKDKAVSTIISTLTKKSSSPTAKNSVLLGVVAGVCARLPGLDEEFRSQRQECFTFYTREFLGSRIRVPAHLVTGLKDIFENFVTLEDFQKDIIPAVEKGLLRAPEVVLNDLVSPVIDALPSSIDLSQVLLKNLLKPLLSNVKSTNIEIKQGTLRTFKTLASRSHEEDAISKVVDEILNPFKQNKITAPDQKTIHAEMLAALTSSASTAKKIVPGLGPVALKEANEGVLEAEVKALAAHAKYGLDNNVTLDTGYAEPFTKGLADKRLTARRIWALQVGDILWSRPDDTLIQSQLSTFITSLFSKSGDVLKEAAANPNAAGANGLATTSFVFTALSLYKLQHLKDSGGKDLVSKENFLKWASSWDGKPSCLLNPRVFTKLKAPTDMIWAARALVAVSNALVSDKCPKEVRTAWSQAYLYFLTLQSIGPSVRQEASTLLTEAYCENPEGIGSILIDGIWTWLRNISLEEKDSVAFQSKSEARSLGIALKSICLSPSERDQAKTKIPASILESQMIDLLVLTREDLIPRVSWIDTCLRVGVDPGKLVEEHTASCIDQILTVSSGAPDAFTTTKNVAAFHAAADLAFVAPQTAIPILLKQIRDDLDPAQLEAIGETEAAIFRTAEGTLYVDILSAKSNQPAPLDRKVKDYDTLKWEAELKAQLAHKQKPTKKLTADEQAKVNKQLAKESTIRQEVAQIQIKLQRGVGIIHALATGPPTEAELWIVQAVDMLQEVIEAGAGLILGDTATVTYLDCARNVTARLGPLRPFIGVATLRAMGVTQLPSELLAESLEVLITRVLWRLRFMAEQRPLDVVSLAYMLPLVFLVLENGGFAAKGSEEADEQLVLAVEFLSFHGEEGASTRLPRRKILSSLISAMQRFNQHYKIIKDCLQNLITNIEPTITKEETDILLKATIVPQVAVRTAVLQSIDNDLDLTDMDYSEEIWIAYHDVVAENSELAQTIWLESDMNSSPEHATSLLKHLESTDRQLRLATAAACAETVGSYWKSFSVVLNQLQDLYIERAKPKAPEKDIYGLVKKTNLADPWEARSGVALAFRALSDKFDKDELASFMQFMIEKGPLGDKNDTVRDEMIDAAKRIIVTTASTKVEELMKLFETTLESPNRGKESFDKVNEAIIILYGALAGHLKPGDKRVPVVVNRLLETLSTPSETVQYAVAECLPTLVRASTDKSSEYVQRMLDDLLQSKSYATRRGAAYGLAGIVSGLGISSLKQSRIMSTLKGATEAKKDQNQRQGAFLAYELFSYILQRVFEPYVIEIVPQLLVGFGDPSADVRDACFDASRTCFASLSSFGVKKVLPVLLEGLEEPQWRSKKGACDSLGAMAHLDPQQLAHSLPEIIPPLANVLNDSHKEVRLGANRALQRFGDVITNPEIKNIVNILLKALSDPVKHTDDALDSLIKIQFVHYLDAPSLALVVRILERGLGDRSLTKRKSAQIIGSLAHLTERKDLSSHLPILIAGLRVAIVDPVPNTRATASKAMGSLVEKLGEDALPDLIPSLMNTLKSDTGAGDRLGSAQALSEVLAGLGTARLEETLPSILQNVASSKPSVREGFMSLFIFLPACFGNSFSNYLSKIIPPILSGLADEIESIRETALRAGRLLVKNFASRAIDLLLPSLENGLADDSYRIRLSSVELVGDLLFNLTGIAGKSDQDEDIEENAAEAGQSLLEVLGEERRNRVLSAIYICRCDTSGMVKAAAVNVWKALVATPRTLREIIPSLTQLIIIRLASSNMEQKVIAGNALGELIRKAGEGVLSTLLPTLEEGLKSTDSQSRQGICIALRDILASSSADALEDYEKALTSTVRTALVDSDPDVREAAAEAFDALQRLLGRKVVDQVLPSLLSLLRNPDDAQNALSALLTLLTDSTRSNIILPTLLPTLLSSPISSFNAQALASLAEVAGSAMTRRLPAIINELVANIISTNDESRLEDLEAALDSVLCSVDADDGLNAMMSVMLGLSKDADHKKRRTADVHFARLFESSDLDISRYYPDLIRAFLFAFNDGDKEVVKAAWHALNSLTKRLRKEEMQDLVISTRQVLLNVGVAGVNVTGFGIEKGINAVLPIFLQGLMNGTSEQRVQAALSISDLADRTSAESLKPFVTQITGPLIRIVSERSVEVKAAILLTLNNLLEKIPQFLKPFLPQLQRTFAKSLADTSSELLRTRAAKCLGTLITMTPRVDPLITELVTGSKTQDAGVRSAMLKALYEVVTKAGKNMTEASRNSILGVIDGEVDDNDDAMAITNARLLGALIKVLSSDTGANLIKTRVLIPTATKSSIVALNAVLVESPDALASEFTNDTLHSILGAIKNTQTIISENAVLAAGKYLLSPAIPKSYETTKPLFDALASVIPPGNPLDVRRLSLVVIRTVSRQSNDLIRPHLPILVLPLFGCVRDMVIPVKLAAEAAFVALFDVVDEEGAVFDKYLASPAAAKDLTPALRRSLGDYFKRVVLRLGGQARERREAEGGAGGLGLASDEFDDEREVWSVGKVDLGEGTFSSD